MSIGGQSRCQPFHSLKVVGITKFVVGFLPRTQLSIFSEDCICFFIVWSGTLGTFLRNLQCFKHALVVTTPAWNCTIGIVAYFVGFCFQGMCSLIKNECLRSKRSDAIFVSSVHHPTQLPVIDVSLFNLPALFAPGNLDLHYSYRFYRTRVCNQNYVTVTVTGF